MALDRAEVERFVIGLVLSVFKNEDLILIGPEALKIIISGRHSQTF